MRFQVGDKIVHPQHGAGVISAVEWKRIGGENRSYYVMHISKGDIRLMIPTESCEQIGVRPVMKPEQAELVFSAIPGLEVSEDKNWNRRYRENMANVQSGDLLRVASVIKSLVRREAEKGLTNGERKQLHAAKQILISEIMLAQGTEYEEVERRLMLAMEHET